MKTFHVNKIHFNNINNNNVQGFIIPTLLRDSDGIFLYKWAGIHILRNNAFEGFLFLPYGKE